jgi:hypothetical protein
MLCEAAMNGEVKSPDLDRSGKAKHNAISKIEEREECKDTM